MWRLRPRGRSEAVRLAVVAALAAGIVVLVVVLSGGSHASHGSAPLSSSSQSPVHVVSSQTGDTAVARSLRRGQMVVVIDQPSSGLFAEQNASIAQGATVAVDELNATGGLARHVRIKLVHQDLEGLSPAAVEGRLRSAAAAVLILPCNTDSQLSLAAGAARYGTLMLAPCNPDPTAGRRFSTYWPVGMTPSEEAAGLVSFIRTVGYGSVFIVSAPSSRYAQLMTSYFRAAAQRKGLRIVGSASVATTTGDLSSLAHVIKAANPRPSTIFTALPPPLVNQLAAGLQTQGVTQNVAGTSAMDTRLTLTSNAGALEDAVIPSYGFPREGAPAHRFATDYKKRFGGEPVGSFPGLGFETIRLLETAVREGRSAEPSAIQRALSRGLALEGVALAERTYQPGGDHNPTGVVAIEKIVSGHLEQVFATTP
jgi:ABC-type branched-subunit amino acid transport system substrate-binding protein